jgi:type VI secretion system protein ImpG
MSYDKLLQLYQNELAFIRNNGAKFAKAHPKLASQLDAKPDRVVDPHMARLVEGIAFTNARIQHKLSEEAFTAHDTLLGILDPNALAPMPAMSIVQFKMTDDATEAPFIPADTTLVSEPVAGCACQFKTRYPVQLLPLAVNRAEIFKSEQSDLLKNCSTQHISALHLTLVNTNEECEIHLSALNQLRFFINAPAQYAYALYCLLFQHTLNIVIASSPEDPNPIEITPRSFLKPVGFDQDSSMLPYNPRSFNGCHLLSEFFVFPEKFLFFELSGVAEAITEKLRVQQSVDLYFLFDQSNPVLEKNINPGFFELGCTPIVNLFEQISEPFLLDGTRVEYLLIPDYRYTPSTIEIFSINKVMAGSVDGTESKEYLPFYSHKANEQSDYYHVTRKRADEDSYPTHGSNVFLSFTHAHQELSLPTVISTQLLCTNRDLPTELPFGSSAPGLKFKHPQIDRVNSIKCITTMTSSHHPAIHKEGKWRAIAALGLNHLNPEVSNDIEHLRGLLTLYSYDQITDEILNGLLSINSKPILLTDEVGNLQQGNEIILQVDESKFNHDNLYLFGSVLNNFFTLQSTLNLATQLIIHNQQKELYRYPIITA